jgi:hypothetical protein
MLDEAGFRPEAKVKVLKAKEQFIPDFSADGVGL